MNKYEIYLPLKYNNGAAGEDTTTVDGYIWGHNSQFTICSIRRHLAFGGVEFVDDIIRIEVITKEELEFFKNFKRRLKRKLRQIEILITMQYIHVI